MENDIVIDPEIEAVMRNRAEHQANNLKLLRDDLLTADRMYLDLELLRDLRIGAILTLLSERSIADASMGYLHLLARLPEYNKRAFSDALHIFPKLGITDAEIDTRLNDPRWHRPIFAVSPATAFIERTLAAHITVNVNHSAVAEKVERGPDGRLYTIPIRLIINTWPLSHLTREMHDLIGASLARKFGVEVEIICENPQTIKVEQWNRFDEIYTTHLQAMMDNKPLNATLSTMRFFKKRLFASRVIRGSFDEKRDTDAEFLAALGALVPLIQMTYIPPDLTAPLLASA